MLVTLSLLSFVIGFTLAVIWVRQENGVPPKAINIPDGMLVVIDRLRKASFGDSLDEVGTRLQPSSAIGHNRSLLLTKDEVEAAFDMSSWQRLAYEEFKTTILAKDMGLRTFPCIYATMGYRSNDHRYLFLESENASEPRNIRLIGPALKTYLEMAPSLGPNTSLVIMGAPSEQPKSVNDYNNHFWDMLRGLRIHDPCSWPENVPSRTESEKWTFCYNNEAIFPVMLTPAHARRFSRHMPVPVIALQPKWVLDQLLSTPEKRQSATAKVRKLLKEYDSIEISPDLTSYGEPGTSESRQLCLEDENLTVQCPYEDLDR